MAQTQAHRGPGRPRSASADAAILAAALKLFTERGFAGASLEAVAEAAGVARTTLYRRWTSKAALIAEAIAAGRGAPELDLTASDLSVAGLRDALVEAISRTLTAPEFRSVMARLVGAGPDHPELLAVYWRAYMAPRRAALVQVIERARAEGMIPPGAAARADPEILLDLIGGALMHHVLVRPGERSAAELRTYLREVLQALGLADAEGAASTDSSESAP